MMELSSGVPEVDNLDIDIDLGDSISHVGTDDLMHDEDTQDLLATADDDEMVDDYEDHGNDEDGMMQYDPQEPQDENLYDIGLDAEGDTELVEAVIDSYDDPSVVEEPDIDFDAYEGTNENTELGHEFGESAVAQIEDVDIDQVDDSASAHTLNAADAGRIQIPEASIQLYKTEHPSKTEQAEQVEIQEAARIEPQHTSQTKQDQLELQPQLEENAYTTDDNTKITVDALAVDDESATQTIESETRHAEISTSQQQDTDQRVEPLVAASNTNTSHPPVIVCFRDSELYLFSTDDQDPAACLLEDVTLLHSSLQQLLKQCRAVLNEHIEPGDTLEMDFAELGLIVNEVGSSVTRHSITDINAAQDSSGASVFTLADIVDIFVQLSQNDGADMSTPLYITLSTKPTFNARMEELSAAVAQGKGLTQLNPEAQVFEEYDNEEHEAIADEQQVPDLPDIEEKEDEQQHDVAAEAPIHTGDEIKEEPEILQSEVTDQPTEQVSEQQTEQDPEFDDTPTQIEVPDTSKDADPISMAALPELFEEQPQQGDLLDFEDEYDETEQQQPSSGEENPASARDPESELPATASINPEDEADPQDEADPEVETSAAVDHDLSQTDGQTDDIGTPKVETEQLETQPTNSDEDYDDLDEDNEQDVFVDDRTADNPDTVEVAVLDESATIGSTAVTPDAIALTQKPAITRKRSRTELEEPEASPSKKQQV